MELTRDRLREVLLAGDGEPFRAVLESLSDEFDVVEVAMAAIHIAHQSSAPEVDEQEIPSASMKGSGRQNRRERTDTPAARMKHGARPDRGQQRNRGHDGDRTRLYVGAGRTNGIRPKDLVGAIAGEAGLAGSEIGPIEIQDRFSLVSVPADKADHVIRSMANVVMRGRRAKVRRERF
jgi:ATP-dependent RNA helicase DeaD